MMALYGGELDNNFQHALQFLDTTDKVGDRYTVIDMGVHTVMEQPLLIFAEDGRTQLETFSAYTPHTALEDRTDIRLEPDTYEDWERAELDDWYGRLQFDTVRDDARYSYRDKNATQNNTARTSVSSVGDLFAGDGAWYVPDDDMITAFEAYLDETDQDDFPEL